MVFSWGTKDYTTYRIGYANSKDGINWTRNDEQSGISVSEADGIARVFATYLVKNNNENLFVLEINTE